MHWGQFVLERTASALAPTQIDNGEQDGQSNPIQPV